MNAFRCELPTIRFFASFLATAGIKVWHSFKLFWADPLGKNLSNPENLVSINEFWMASSILWPALSCSELWTDFNWGWGGGYSLSTFSSFQKRFYPLVLFYTRVSVLTTLDSLTKRGSIFSVNMYTYWYFVAFVPFILTQLYALHFMCDYKQIIITLYFAPF